MKMSGGSTRRVRPVSGLSVGAQAAAMANEKLLSVVVANDLDIDYGVMAAGNSGEKRTQTSFMHMS